jgi:hypothetical protein
MRPAGPSRSGSTGRVVHPIRYRPFKSSVRLGECPAEPGRGGARTGLSPFRGFFRRPTVYRPEGHHHDGSRRAACHIRREEKLLGPAQIPALLVCSCTGARALLDRELLRYVQHGPEASALTELGARRHATVMLGRDDLLSEDELDALDWRQLLECASPSLLDERIRYEDVAPPSEQERQDWGATVMERAA